MKNFTRTAAVAAALTTGLLMLQGLVLVFASGTSGGKVVALGTLKSLRVYQDLVPDPALRGMNDGLLLDSIDSPRAAALAALVTFVVLYITFR